VIEKSAYLRRKKDVEEEMRLTIQSPVAVLKEVAERVKMVSQSPLEGEGEIGKGKVKEEVRGLLTA
jgi:hypothetical protein